MRLDSRNDQGVGLRGRKVARSTPSHSSEIISQGKLFTHHSLLVKCPIWGPCQLSSQHQRNKKKTATVAKGCVNFWCCEVYSLALAWTSPFFGVGEVFIDTLLCTHFYNIQNSEQGVHDPTLQQLTIIPMLYPIIMMHNADVREWVVS